MATKKKDELAKDPRIEAALKAIASGDKSAVDMTVVQEILSGLGLKAFAQGAAVERYSRKAKVEEYLHATELSEDDKLMVKRFAEAVGKTPVIQSAEEAADVNQATIDAIMETTLVTKPVQDIAKGQYERDRASILNLMTFRDPEQDPNATGTISSPVHGHKFVVSKSERVPEPNYAALEDVVDPEVWDDITDEIVVREVDEDRLALAMQTCKHCPAGKQHTAKMKHDFEPKVTLEQFQAVIGEVSVSRRLLVQPLKEGDPIG